ncbi:hypothetical protein FOVG_12815 [Fusarium oxysporum f. sp. pisi HDV247]|uniref:Uncharacterized protein n=1 Tax=Fusarium oxysporum f. sp. pisi HDV247 TaxID=1080344 RepID=W9P1U2_FUSOX|nr:hypothetical protein FOVG_12815 [Fusarium oxysporum f. sp. pisi HDV247]
MPALTTQGAPVGKAQSKRVMISPSPIVSAPKSAATPSKNGRQPLLNTAKRRGCVRRIWWRVGDRFATKMPKQENTAMLSLIRSPIWKIMKNFLPSTSASLVMSDVSGDSISAITVLPTVGS